MNMQTPEPGAERSREEDGNPFPWYARMRRESPAVVDSQSGALSVFRYDDVQRVLSDYAVFSSARGNGGGPGESALSASLISSDPPRHRQLRNLITQVFTPRAVGPARAARQRDRR